jgi:hypothetical protein
MSAHLDITVDHGVGDHPLVDTSDPEGAELADDFVRRAMRAVEGVARSQDALVPPMARAAIEARLRNEAAQFSMIVLVQRDERIAELRVQIDRLEGALDLARSSAEGAHIALEDAASRYAASRGVDLQLVRALCTKLLDATEPT